MVLMNIDAFEQREQILQLRAKVLQTEQVGSMEKIPLYSRSKKQTK